MLELEDALGRIVQSLPPVATEQIPLVAADGRIAAEPLFAAVDLPPFDNSAMDGYAVQASDTRSARADHPVCLRLAGRVAAGQIFNGALRSGECVRLFTGSPMPAGADAVVMQEDTAPSTAGAADVQILEPAEPGENVRRRGEDVPSGRLLVQKGQALTPGILGLLGASGISKVRVGKRPVVGVLATGSELREPGLALGPGEIYESNRASLGALAAHAGAPTEIFPLVQDSAEATHSALASAFERCDLLVTSGGVSVGEMDFVKSAFEQLGGRLDFWKVAIKPGRPFVFGTLGKKFLFGLPGNPVSAAVTFLLLVRPAIRHWQGAKDVGLPSLPGIAAEPLANPGGRRHFMRVVVNDSGQVRSAGLQASHALSSLAAANGLVDLAPGTTIAAGASVRVLRW